jgi:hypothetical protein
MTPDRLGPRRKVNGADNSGFCFGFWSPSVGFNGRIPAPLAGNPHAGRRSDPPTAGSNHRGRSAGESTSSRARTGPATWAGELSCWNSSMAASGRRRPPSPSSRGTPASPATRRQRWRKVVPAVKGEKARQGGERPTGRSDAPWAVACTEQLFRFGDPKHSCRQLDRWLPAQPGTEPQPSGRRLSQARASSRLRRWTDKTLFVNVAVNIIRPGSDRGHGGFRVSLTTTQRN